ncbi:MAG: hypothetical protein V1755_01580 [Chloroflexota bacterium]
MLATVICALFSHDDLFLRASLRCECQRCGRLSAGWTTGPAPRVVQQASAWRAVVGAILAAVRG